MSSERLWHFDTMSFWVDGPTDNECTQWWEISPFRALGNATEGGPRYVGEGIFRRPMTLVVLTNRPRDLPESYEPSDKPWQMIGGELVPTWTTPAQRVPPGWNGEWANGTAEAISRMREHLDRCDPEVPHVKFDARDRKALRYIVDRLEKFERGERP